MYSFYTKPPDYNMTSWIHVALVYNASGNTVVGYLNAETDKWTNNYIGGATTNNYAGHWRIGKYYDGHGLTKVDELIFWDSALTLQQIKTIYDSYGSK